MSVLADKLFKLSSGLFYSESFSHRRITRGELFEYPENRWGGAGTIVYLVRVSEFAQNYFTADELKEALELVRAGP